MLYVIGLGNPEEKYIHTRHNVGSFLVEELNVLFSGTEFKKQKHLYARISKVVYENTEIIFVIPEVYMNESGKTAKAIFDLMKTEDSLVIIHDDLDFACGEYKLSLQKGDGGHNGITSVNHVLAGKNFLRLRVGVSPVDEEGIMHRVRSEDQATFVLQRFSKKEQEIISSLIKKMGEVLISIAQEGAPKTMTLYNR